MEAQSLLQARTKFSVDLHPAYSGNALQGVLLQLESRLLKWDDELDGVLLGYKNIQKLPSQAAIRPYFPYIQLSIKADALIFAPKVGHVLCGQVTKIGADYIGMTLLGAINAAVGRQNIRPELHYNPQGGFWESSNPDGNIKVGGDVIFAVDGLRIESNGVLAVLGSLKEAWTGAVQAAAKRKPAAFTELQHWQSHQPDPLLQSADPLPVSGALAVDAVPLAKAQNEEIAEECKAEIYKKRKRSEPWSPPPLLQTETKPNSLEQPGATSESKRERKRKKKDRGHLAESNAILKDPGELDKSDQSLIQSVVASQKKRRKAEEEDQAEPDSVLMSEGARQEARDGGKVAEPVRAAEDQSDAAIANNIPSHRDGHKEGKKKKKKGKEKGLPNGTALHSEAGVSLGHAHVSLPELLSLEKEKKKSKEKEKGGKEKQSRTKL